jgi:hypothetical protein
LSPKDDLDVYASFLNDRQRAEVGFVSHSHRPNLNIYWINPTDGTHVSVGALVYGERNTVWQVSHLGHHFILVDDESEEVLEKYTIKFHSFFVYGEGGSATRKMDVTRRIEDTLRNEYYRSRNVKRTFTEVGFARDKLPRDLFSSMQSYYYNNRHNSLREEWETKGLFVNWWESDVYMVSMPWGLKVS